MPQIIIENLFNKSIKFAGDSKSVLKIMQKNYIDWMHACGGKGRCTTCKMTVIQGEKNLSDPTPFEKKCLKAQLLNEDQRLACQCYPEGDLVVKVPDENKLPHMEYSG